MTERPPPSKIASLILRGLRTLDRDADTVRDGYATGLNWFGPHARPELKRPQTEPEWTKALAAFLGEQGLDVVAEHPFPDIPRQRCDLVVQSAAGLFWIEIKGAWKHYWSKKSDWIYRSYFFHPLIEGLDAKSHTIPLDLVKLSRLTRDDASHIGVVLVGFDSTEHPMESDVDELKRLAMLAPPQWSEASDSWDDERRPDEHVRCWAWWRTVEASP